MAKRKGVELKPLPGRVSKWTKDDYEEMFRLRYDEKMKVIDIAEKFGCCRGIVASATNAIANEKGIKLRRSINDYSDKEKVQIFEMRATGMTVNEVIKNCIKDGMEIGPSMVNKIYSNIVEKKGISRVKGKGSTVSDEEKLDIFNAVLDGDDINDVAQKFGRVSRTVKKVCKEMTEKLGVEIPKLNLKRKISEKEKIEIFKLYQKGETLMKLTKKFRRSRRTIVNVCNEFNQKDTIK